jgi:hypothetical protein
MISNGWSDISGAKGLFKYENSSRFEQNVQWIHDKGQRRVRGKATNLCSNYKGIRAQKDVQSFDLTSLPPSPPSQKEE